VFGSKSFTKREKGIVAWTWIGASSLSGRLSDPFAIRDNGMSMMRVDMAMPC
jgi:predicted membrane chloride channel (bestrophin family)